MHFLFKKILTLMQKIMLKLVTIIMTELSIPRFFVYAVVAD